MSLNFGYFIKKGLTEKDNLRIRHSERQLRTIAKNWNDKENHAEGDKPSNSRGQF